MILNKITDIVNLPEKDFELFQASVRYLITDNFILRGAEEHRAYYRFISEHSVLVESYLYCAGWNLKIDETAGLISWSGPGSNRINFSIDETLFLFVMRLLYEEKRHEISLNEYPLIYQRDFHDRYAILCKRAVKKTRFREILKKFQTLKLIKVSGDETDPESRLVLYPSIAVAVDANVIDEVYTRIANLDNDTEPIGDDEIYEDEDGGE